MLLRKIIFCLFITSNIFGLTLSKNWNLNFKCFRAIVYGDENAMQSYITKGAELSASVDDNMLEAIGITLTDIINLRQNSCRITLYQLMDIVGYKLNSSEDDATTALDCILLNDYKELKRSLAKLQNVDALLPNEFFIDLSELFHDLSLLCAAIIFKNIKAVKLLLEAGANIHFRTRGGATPLHLAVIEPKILKLMLTYQPDINAQDDEGFTPLHAAGDLVNDYSKIAEESARLLLEHGAKFALLNNKRETANFVARQNDHDFIKIFVEVDKAEREALETYRNLKSSKIFPDAVRHLIVDYVGVVRPILH